MEDWLLTFRLHAQASIWLCGTALSDFEPASSHQILLRKKSLRQLLGRIPASLSNLKNKDHSLFCQHSETHFSAKGSLIMLSRPCPKQRIFNLLGFLLFALKWDQPALLENRGRVCSYYSCIAYDTTDSFDIASLTQHINLTPPQIANIDIDYVGAVAPSATSRHVQKLLAAHDLYAHQRH